MVGSFAGCCARAENGHATAAPPTSVMRSRRPIIRSPRRRARGRASNKEPRLPHCAASILSISGPNLGLACNSSRNALVASSKGLRTMSLTIVTPALTASFRD
jgi:hypothetical protein